MTTHRRMFFSVFVSRQESKASLKAAKLVKARKRSQRKRRERAAAAGGGEGEVGGDADEEEADDEEPIDQEEEEEEEEGEEKEGEVEEEEQEEGGEVGGGGPQSHWSRRQTFIFSATLALPASLRRCASEKNGARAVIVQDGGR